MNGFPWVPPIHEREEEDNVDGVSDTWMKDDDNKKEEGELSPIRKFDIDANVEGDDVA